MDFQTWAAKHGKTFSIAEGLRRKAIFNQNAKFVAKFNKENSFQLSVEGPFAAMTNEEYKSMLTKRAVKKQGEVEELSVKADSSVDWRAKGKVPPVRDQAQCGSCYSFGSLAALEGRLLIQKGGNTNSMDLSEEQIVQCSKNHGCNGGTGSVVYDYIISNGGVAKESDYPYTAKDASCDQSRAKKVYAKITGYKSVASKNTGALKQALTEGLVDVSIDASSAAFQMYNGGAYTDSKCGTSLFDLNHEVCAVGYGVVDGKECWIVRNSWGTSWGDKGYIYMVIDGNTCGVSTDPIYPTGVSYA
jgi:histolysain